jgi:hypothetical protein
MGTSDELPPPPAAQQPSQQSPKPKSANTMIMVVVVVAVVAVAAVAAIMLMNSGGGAASPEGAIDGYLANAKDGDLDGALAYTDAAFYDDATYDELRDDMEDSMDESEIEDVEILDVVDIPEDEMSAEMLEGFTEMKSEYAERFAEVSDETISAFKMVNVTMRNGNETQTMPMLFVKIDGGWYLALGGMMMDGGDEPDAPLAASLTYLVSDSNPTNGTATFMLSIVVPTAPSLDDITLIIYDADGDQVTSGAWANWTHLATVEGSDYVSGGDRLVLEAPGQDVSGWEVMMAVDGYPGTASAFVPE